MNNFMTLVGFGLLTGGTIIIPALGMTLMYGSSKFLNFAYGDFMTLAAFLTITFSWFAPLPVAIIGSILIMAVFGPVVHHLIFAPLAGRASLVLLVTSLGLSFVLLNSIRAIWGTKSRRIATPSSLNEGINFGPIQTTQLQLIILAIAVVVTAVVSLALFKTDLGIKIRAVAENPQLASSSGVTVSQLRAVTWSIASALAALGGILIALSVTFTADLGFSFLLTVAVAVILGGVGSPLGAVVGAMIIGLLTELSTAWIDPSLKSGVAFAALALVMIVKPSGIFGKVEA